MLSALDYYRSRSTYQYMWEFWHYEGMHCTNKEFSEKKEKKFGFIPYRTIYSCKITLPNIASHPPITFTVKFIKYSRVFFWKDNKFVNIHGVTAVANCEQSRSLYEFFRDRIK